MSGAKLYFQASFIFVSKAPVAFAITVFTVEKILWQACAFDVDNLFTVVQFLTNILDLSTNQQAYHATQLITYVQRLIVHSFGALLANNTSTWKFARNKHSSL